MCEEFVCRYMYKDNLLKILTTLYLRKLNSIILHFGYVPKSKELIDCVKYRMQNNAFHILDMDTGSYTKSVCKHGKVLLFHLPGVRTVLKILHCVIINLVLLPTN